MPLRFVLQLVACFFLRSVSQLDDEAIVNDALYSLHVLKRLEAGLLEAAAGPTIPDEAIKELLRPPSDDDRPE